MADKEPRNPFYLLLLLTGILFAITAVAYAVVPWAERKALAAGETPPPSAFRDALRVDGWKWLLILLLALVAFGLLSMAVDRLRSLRNERQSLKMPENNHRSTPP